MEVENRHRCLGGAGVGSGERVGKMEAEQHHHPAIPGTINIIIALCISVYLTWHRSSTVLIPHHLTMVVLRSIVLLCVQ